MQLQKGMNTDIQLLGVPYHVQTEDWGMEKQMIVTKVFKNGAVVKSIKTPYQNLLANGREANVTTIKVALREQHQRILDLLLSSQLL